MHYFGCTTVEYAAAGGHIQVVGRLLAHVRHGPSYTNGVLETAARGGHEQLVIRLLAAGADVNAQRGHLGTAHQLAAERCD